MKANLVSERLNFERGGKDPFKHLDIGIPELREIRVMLSEIFNRYSLDIQLEKVIKGNVVGYKFTCDSNGQDKTKYFVYCDRDKSEDQYPWFVGWRDVKGFSDDMEGKSINGVRVYLEQSLESFREGWKDDLWKR